MAVARARPTSATLRAAAGTNVTPDNFAITDEPGNNVWPFATYSWAIVPKTESSEATCEAVTKYLDWETHYGQNRPAPRLRATCLCRPRRAPTPEPQLETVTSGGTVCVTQKS